MNFELIINNYLITFNKNSLKIVCIDFYISLKTGKF